MGRKIMATRLEAVMLAFLTSIVLAFTLALVSPGPEKAWAAVTMNQITEDMIAPGSQNLTPDDLPRFSVTSFDDAKALCDARGLGDAGLIYSVDDDGVTYLLLYRGGQYKGSQAAKFSHDDLLRLIKDYGPFYYTTNDASYWLIVEAYDITEKKIAQGGTVSDGGDFATHMNNTFMVNSRVTITAKPDEGYDFVGWVTNFKEGDDVAALKADISDNPYTFTIGQNSTAYAQFQKQVHTVTFDSMGGTDVPAAKVTHGELAPRPDPAPTKGNGLRLLGWYTDKEHTKAFDFFNTPITEDITLYAGWGNTVIVDMAGDNYGAVSIDDSEPAAGAVEDVFEGDAVTIKATTPSVTLFINFTNVETGKVVSTDPEYTFTFDGTMREFVANYKPNMTTAIYDLNGGHAGPNPPPHTMDVRVGGTIGENPVPTSKDDWATPPDGYVFDGYQIIDDENNVHDFKPGDVMEYTIIGPTVIKFMWAPKSSEEPGGKIDENGNSGNNGQSNSGNNGQGNGGSVARSNSGGNSQSKVITPKTGDSLSAAAMPLSASAGVALLILALALYRKRRGENR